MKIGIDARLYGSAGIGRYISNLIKNLEDIDKQNEYIIFVTKEGSEAYHPKNPNFKKWVVNYKIYSVGEQTGLWLTYLRAGLDLLHVPHFNIPILYHKKIVATIHDLTMHDQSQDASTQSVYTYVFKQLGYKIVSNLAVVKSKVIFVPSAVVRDELKQKLPLMKTSKALVTYEGVDPDIINQAPKDEKVISTRLEEMGIKSGYFLYVGSAYPHKNLQNLVISYKDLVERTMIKNQLVIAGKIDTFSQRLAGFIHALKLDYNVIFAARFAENQFLTDKDLAYLYKGAGAYVFPSLSEGFSITPLEAQSLGIPAAVSDIPTHREVFGDSVLYFDPKSAVDTTDKLMQILTDSNLRKRLVELGNENAKKYSWKIMAERTLQGYLKNAE